MHSGCEHVMLVLQPLRWRCVDCVIHHERDVREEKRYMYVARTSNNRVIPMEWYWWVTSNNACEPGEQLIVLAECDDESDIVGWSLLLLAATVRSFADSPLGISDRNTRTNRFWIKLYSHIVMSETSPCAACQICSFLSSNMVIVICKSKLLAVT